MKEEIGFFFCGNCGRQYNADVTYDDEPKEDCPRCGFEDWIFEPTGEKEGESHAQ